MIKETVDFKESYKEQLKKKKTNEDTAIKLAYTFYSKREAVLLEQQAIERKAKELLGQLSIKELSYSNYVDYCSDGLMYLYESKGLQKCIDLERCKNVGVYTFSASKDKCAELQINIQSFIEKQNKILQFPLCCMLRSFMKNDKLSLVVCWPKGKQISTIKFTEKEKKQLLSILAVRLEAYYSAGLSVFLSKIVYIDTKCLTVSFMIDFDKTFAEGTQTIDQAKKWNEEILSTVANT